MKGGVDLPGESRSLEQTKLRRLGSSELDVFPLCLGGNVFGWTLDERGSFRILDVYADAAGNFIDTADRYSAWAPGNSGGESETIIGRWMKTRRNRDSLVIATKVGLLEGALGLSERSIRDAVEASLRRLQTDRIDLYYAHRDDLSVSQHETQATLDALIREGKVRYVGASNFSCERLKSALLLSEECGLARYVALQIHYNLIHRFEYEGPVASLCAGREVGCVAYSALASGFLTGKYRRADPPPTGARAEEVSRHLSEPSFRILDLVERVARDRNEPISSIAVAWLLTRREVTALASATSEPQLRELLRGTDLSLSKEELTVLEPVV